MRTRNVLAARKPIDLGDGRLVASFAASRPALLSVTCYHAQHGVAELSAIPAFDEGARGNPDEVRRYRRLLASDDFPCLWLESAGGKASAKGALGELVDTTDTERPRWGGAEAWAEDGAIVLAWRIPPEETAGPRLRFTGRIDRPAMAEITELDPPPATHSVTTLSADGSRLVVRASLPAVIVIDAGAGTWTIAGDEATLEVGPTDTLSVWLTTLDDLPRGRLCARGSLAEQLGLNRNAARFVDRALAYTRRCAAISTATDEAAILADHRLLPLSWTRDSYYQARLLLATGVPADADLVADHLRWLWRRCERPDGRWLRSHHANGRPKDLAFQADQQLYPLLELADYWRARAALPIGVDWATEVDRAWAATIAEVDHSTGFIATAENAADDPAPAPYVASSQVLLWYVCLRLAELADAGALPIDADELRAVAAAAQNGFERHLVETERWLYATDTQGIRVHYHDANDLPVALAPLLGFCSADDRGWRGTMGFAFSTANPGYFGGERGGLGSVHTPQAWTLGDIQAWIHARITTDEAGMVAAADRLAAVCFHDGMLPEAYSTTLDPDVRIRHWFAWPGAAFGALLLLDARGELDRLRAG